MAWHSPDTAVRSILPHLAAPKAHLLPYISPLYSLFLLLFHPPPPPPTPWPSVFLSGSLSGCQERTETIQKHHQNHAAATATPCARFGIFPFLAVFLLLFLLSSPLHPHVAPRLVILGWASYPWGPHATPHSDTPVCCPPGRLSMEAVALCHLPA